MREEDKQSLRRAMRDRRDRYSSVAENSRHMEELLLASSLYRQARQVLAYAPFRNEPDFLGVLRQARREGKEVGIPRILGPGQMIFQDAAEPERWRRNTWGIPEPEDGARVLYPGPDTLILVPGLLFDRRGYRLGYGGGFYDRYLAEHPEAVTVGLAFSFQVTESLPAEDYDRPVAWILTETELIRTERSNDCICTG